MLQTRFYGVHKTKEVNNRFKETLLRFGLASFYKTA